MANHENILNQVITSYFRVVEHDWFFCVTVVSEFLDFLNQKIGLSFRLPQDCWIRILQNVSAVAVRGHSMRRKDLMRKGFSTKRI